MRKTSFFLLLTVGLTTTVGLTANNTVAIQNATNDLTETPFSNTTARRGRHIKEIIELPIPSKKIKRQIIKIPPNVSKVKLVQPPLNLRQNRAPQQFNRYPAMYRSGDPRRPSSKKSQIDYDFEKFNSFLYDPKKIKRNLKKPILQEVSPEKFLRDEKYEFDFEEGKHRPKKFKKHESVQNIVKIKRKKPKQNILNEFETNYEGSGQFYREKDGGFDGSKIYSAGTEDNLSVYGYDSAESNIHMKLIPSSNLFPRTPPQQYLTDKVLGQFYNENYVPGLNIKKLPTHGRQIQSLFSQQYTTHNPHVTTNFGLGEVTQSNVLQYNAGGSFAQDFSHLRKYKQPVVAASDQVVTALPVKTTGIQVIQPPQFKKGGHQPFDTSNQYGLSRDVTVSQPSHSSRLISSLSQQKEETFSQKATIKDILDQDCPSFDSKGYCDSPPRYPMQQIKNMVKKCANLMEVMNTQPFEEPQEVYSFVKRFDNYEEHNNKSFSVGVGMDNQSTWSRSASDGVTACISDLELTEPGYAKEVSSGRWFVIVQHPDTTIQRIATDTCRNPGKFCGGLSDLKCNKISSLPSKSTRCVQRYTYQRLISWDPDLPDDCPRMRVFRFPSSCICHLGII